MTATAPRTRILILDEMKVRLRSFLLERLR